MKPRTKACIPLPKLGTANIGLMQTFSDKADPPGSQPTYSLGTSPATCLDREPCSNLDPTDFKAAPDACLRPLPTMQRGSF